MVLKKIKVGLLIFDLDGTLVDTGQDIVNAVNYACTKSGLVSLPAKEIIKKVGNGIRKMLEDCTAGTKNVNLDDLIDSFSNYYGEHLLDNSKLYPGVKEVLERYKIKKKVVISNKRQFYCIKLLSGLNIKQEFEFIWGIDSLTKFKPDPAPIIEASKNTGCSLEDTIIVGDGVNDILSANAAGIKSCAAGYGFTDKDELMAQKPTYFVDKLDEIFDFVI